MEKSSDDYNQCFATVIMSLLTQVQQRLTESRQPSNSHTQRLSEAIEFFYKSPDLSKLKWLEEYGNLPALMGELRAQMFILASRVTHDETASEADRDLFNQWRRYLYDVSRNAIPSDVDLMWTFFWATGNQEFSDMVLFISETHPDASLRRMCELSYADVSRRHGFQLWESESDHQ